MTRVEIDVIVFGEGVNFLLIGASDYDALVLLTTGMAAVEIMLPRPAAVEGDEAGRHLIESSLFLSQYFREVVGCITKYLERKAFL